MKYTPVNPIADAAIVSEMDAYLFDLRGFLTLKQAVNPAHVSRMNRVPGQLMAIDPIWKNGEWHGSSGGNFRHPDCPSDELLARLTAYRSKIVMHQQLIPRLPYRLENEDTLVKQTMKV